MLNTVLMILSSIGMLCVGWFVWKKVQAQDASTDVTQGDTHSDDDSDADSHS